MTNRYSAIIRLGLPILVGQLGMIVVGFADNIMLGRYSTAALASASLVNNLFNVAIFACIGFTYGVTPLVGALFGQKRYGAIGALMRNAVVINTLFALLVTLAMWIVYINLENMGQPSELLPMVRPYYLTALAGMLPITLFNVFAQWSYGITRSQMPMWIILISNAMNIAGNYALIYGNWGCPELGLLGAGYSTLAARWFCPIVIAVAYFGLKRFREYRRGFLEARQTRRQWSIINRTSWPVSGQMIFESGSFTIAAVMAGWLGAIPLAAFQIIVIIGTLGFCIYYSVGSAISVLVANDAGRGSVEAMRHTAFAGYHIMLALATVSSLIFIFLGKHIIGAFTVDPEVIAVTLTLIVPLVVYQLGDATQITFANALRGTSRVAPMLWIAFISYVIVGIPATYAFGFTFRWGIVGIILSFSVSLFLAGALFLSYFIMTTRRRRAQEATSPRE